MQPINQAVLETELERDEGLSRVIYPDSEGNPTIGVGHNLAAAPLPAGWAPPLSNDQISQLLGTDLNETFAELDAHLPWWATLDAVRQRVVANMCFNMGIGKLLGFRHMLAAAQQGNYGTAADEMENSTWYGEVGDRAVRLCYMMRYGEVQDGEAAT